MVLSPMRDTLVKGEKEFSTVYMRGCYSATPELEPLVRSGVREENNEAAVSMEAWQHEGCRLREIKFCTYLKKKQ